MASFMAEYSQSGDKFNANIHGFTDATWYTKNATSIDFSHGVNYYEDGKAYTYTLALEILSGGSWTAVQLLTGSFVSNVTKVFPLSGKKAGLYRVVGYYTKNGTTYTNRTNDFTVQR